VVSVNRLCKMMHCAPCTEEVTAPQMAHLFIREVYRHHGMPLDIVSDSDTRFTSTFWMEVMDRLDTHLAFSTAFHPQCDGQTEQVNQVEDMLRCYVNAVHDDWDQHLPLVEFAYNNAYHESVRSTPVRLNYGEDPHVPAAHPGRPKNIMAGDWLKRLCLCELKPR
jgi:hypothetical protein